MINIRILSSFITLPFRFTRYLLKYFSIVKQTHTQRVIFQAPEYQPDGFFKSAQYEYIGNANTGWTIRKNGKYFQYIGSGYALVKSLYCGVCSTDLIRHLLPYHLPQIIGHEVVGAIDNIPIVSEINASHLARNDHPDKCPYCKEDMHTHCPNRLTLGINILPGGFSPFFLAPVATIRKVPKEIGIKTACIIEPFAAALHAVMTTPPGKGDSVAVVGPRRLGMLIIAALHCFRREHGLQYTITGIVRHKHLEELCFLLGADKVINISDTKKTKLKQRFDIVFDTTGNPEGFELALNSARHILHLKSTHGSKVMGMKHLSDMVVDEIALLPYKIEFLNFNWPIEQTKRRIANIFVTPTVSENIINHAGKVHPDISFFRSDIEKAYEMIKHDSTFFKDSPVPKFDLAIVTNLNEIDSVIRPTTTDVSSIIRPRGAILLASLNTNIHESLLSESILDRGVEIHTSRCGDFKLALEMLKINPEMTKILEEKFITHCFSLKNIDTAFMIAKDSEQSIKVVIKINEVT